MQATREDILLYLLLQFPGSLFGEHYFDTRSLHRVWALYMRLLKKCGIEIEGFYKDPITYRYPALDKALHGLVMSGEIQRTPLTECRERFILTVTLSDKRKIEGHADPQTLAAVKRVFPRVEKHYQLVCS